MFKKAGNERDQYLQRSSSDASQSPTRHVTKSSPTQNKAKAVAKEIIALTPHDTTAVSICEIESNEILEKARLAEMSKIKLAEINLRDKELELRKQELEARAAADQATQRMMSAIAGVLDKLTTSLAKNT